MTLDADLSCRDVAAQLAFCQSLRGLPGHLDSRQPFHRVLHGAHFPFGLHAQPACGLPGLGAAAGPE